MPFIGTTPTQGFVGANPKQSFTANGSTTVFTLTNPVASANDLEVFVGNVRQEPTAAYSAAGTTLTMSEAPDTGLNFYVINKSQAQVTTTPPADSVDNTKIDFKSKTTMTGDGSDTTLTINSGRTVDDVLVFVNGICLVPTDDYTISGTTLTFVTAPSIGAEVTVRYIG